MKSTVSKCCFRPILPTGQCECCGLVCRTLNLFMCEVCGIVSDRESTVCTTCEEVMSA